MCILQRFVTVVEILAEDKCTTCTDKGFGCTLCTPAADIKVVRHNAELFFFVCVFF